MAVRPISKAYLTDDSQEQQLNNLLTRQVVMVTTRDRLMIPPIAHFYQLVKDLEQSSPLSASQLVS